MSRLSGLDRIKQNQDSLPRRARRQQPDVTDGGEVTFQPGGYSLKNWAGVYGPFLKTLSLVETKICDFPYPTNLSCPDQKRDT